MLKAARAHDAKKEITGPRSDSISATRCAAAHLTISQRRSVEYQRLMPEAGNYASAREIQRNGQNRALWTIVIAERSHHASQRVLQLRSDGAPHRAGASGRLFQLEPLISTPRWRVRRAHSVRTAPREAALGHGQLQQLRTRHGHAVALRRGRGDGLHLSHVRQLRLAQLQQALPGRSSTGYTRRFWALRCRGARSQARPSSARARAPGSAPQCR
jgi:hypothetical protein